MAIFVCEILDTGTGRRTERIEAASQEDAKRQLSRAGGLIVSVREESEARSGFFRGLSRRKLRSPELSTFCTVLAGYLGAGVPLRDALLLIGHSHRRLSAVALGAAQGVARGQSLEDALADLPQTLPPSFLMLVRAAREAGMLPEALKAEGKTLERSVRIRRDLAAAMAYPVALTLIALVVMALLLLVVVPQIRASIPDASLPFLPFSSRVIFAASGFLVELDPLHVLVVAIAIAVLFFLLSRVRKNRPKSGLARWPLVGPIARDLSLAAFCRSFGMLLGASMRAERAWALAARTVPLEPWRSLLEKAGTTISEGGQVSDVLRALPHVPADLPAIVKLGERSGSLPVVLAEAGERYVESSLSRLQKLSAAAGPTVIILLGLMIGFFAVGIMSAILSVNEIYGR
jgi:type IV pilus assembly protein PilC